MLYEVPNATDLVGLFSYAQSIVPFSQLVVLAVFFTSFISLKRYETVRALPSSLFITFISSLFFHLLGMLEVFWVLGTAVLLALSVIIIYFSRD